MSSSSARLAARPASSRHKARKTVQQYWQSPCPSLTTPSLLPSSPTPFPTQPFLFGYRLHPAYSLIVFPSHPTPSLPRLFGIYFLFFFFSFYLLSFLSVSSNSRHIYTVTLFYFLHHTPMYPQVHPLTTPLYLFLRRFLSVFDRGNHQRSCNIPANIWPGMNPTSCRKQDNITDSIHIYTIKKSNIPSLSFPGHFFLLAVSIYLKNYYDICITPEVSLLFCLFSMSFLRHAVFHLHFFIFYLGRFCI